MPRIVHINHEGIWKQLLEVIGRSLTLPVIPGLRVYRRSTIDLSEICHRSIVDLRSRSIIDLW